MDDPLGEADLVVGFQPIDILPRCAVKMDQLINTLGVLVGAGDDVIAGMVWRAAAEIIHVLLMVHVQTG